MNRGTTGSIFEIGDRYYKHIYSCPCGWKKVIISAKEDFDIRRAELKHNNHRPNCLLFEVGCEKTEEIEDIRSHELFKEDIK